ncbi:MAG TPA: VanZ family protein [Longimicrobium sp.]
MRGAVSRWLPVLAWAAAIFWLSSQSTLPHLPRFVAWDKLQHALGYSVGGFLLARAVGVRGRGTVIAAALGMLYGASDEVHQAFVPGRSTDVLDWTADAVGVLAGVFIYRFIHPRRARGGSAAASAAEASAT